MSKELEKIQVNAASHLTVAGVDTVDLAQKYGTPLQVFDVQKIRQQVRAFKSIFKQHHVNSVVSYASKAFATIAIYQVMAQEGAHIDVVSGGELATALAANFPVEHISFHGNNKSKSELEMAIEHHVGYIIVDNFHEIELLTAILAHKNNKIKVIIRVAPGVSAHTHEYDQTGQIDSKFGFDIESGQADQAVKLLLANPNIDLVGVHAHIGSQIFEVDGFKLVATKMMMLLKEWQDKFGFQSRILNVGGGFGIQYTADDDPLSPEEFVGAIITTVKEQSALYGVAVPEIWIEPGRSIVGNAGITLYTVGGRKNIPGLTPYLFVDGGMGDNIRPALYQAKYRAVLASNVTATPKEMFHIAGKYCESGDILIKEQLLPDVDPGDILAVLATGAYGYSMASNYNRNPRPAVVFVENDHTKVVVKRETYADMIRLDQSYI